MRQSINRKKLLCLLILAFLAAAGYMTIGVKFAKSKLASYAMRIRTPKRSDYRRGYIWQLIH